MSASRNPSPCADLIIEIDGGIVLIERAHEPKGWALPGGFIDYGEQAEDAAVREAKEETGLDIELIQLLGVYSHPDRDPRFHTLSAAYVARASGVPQGGDDAKRAAVFKLDALPETLCFDHAKILSDYAHYKKSKELPRPAIPMTLSALELADLKARAAHAAGLGPSVPAEPSARARAPGEVLVGVEIDGAWNWSDAPVRSNNRSEAVLEEVRRLKGQHAATNVTGYVLGPERAVGNLAWIEPGRFLVGARSLTNLGWCAPAGHSPREQIVYAQADLRSRYPSADTTKTTIVAWPAHAF